MLHVEEATKAFGGILALNRVSFDVNQGDILGIIGPNGSGKTTLVNCITGFVTMTSGKIFFKGREITGKPAHKIADLGVTRTFQIMRPYYSLPGLQEPGHSAFLAQGKENRRVARGRKAGRQGHGGD